MPIAELADRAILEVSGAEATTFLNGLLTNDVAALSLGATCYAGLLSPQGKALFDVFAVRHEDGFLLDVAAARAPELLKKLTMYKLRAAVTLKLRPNLAVIAGWDDMPTPANGRPDSRCSALGWRAIAAAESLHASNVSTLIEYHTHRISHGIPDTVDIGIDQLLWLETNADLLGGVSFTKGCYVGQENTARMHHRKKVLKRIWRVTSTEGLPGFGTQIFAGEKPAGHLLSVMGDQGLALLRLEYLTSGATLTASAEPIRVDIANYISDAFS